MSAVAAVLCLSKQNPPEGWSSLTKTECKGVREYGLFFRHDWSYNSALFLLLLV